jgi:hypothetical protein
MKKTSESSIRLWCPNTLYNVGDKIKFPYSTLVYICVAAGESGPNSPTRLPNFTGIYLYDAYVTWIFDVNISNYGDPEPMYDPDTGKVIGAGCQANEATPKYYPPLIEEREV